MVLIEETGSTRQVLLAGNIVLARLKLTPYVPVAAANSPFEDGSLHLGLALLGELVDGVLLGFLLDALLVLTRAVDHPVKVGFHVDAPTLYGRVIAWPEQGKLLLFPVLE